MTALRISIIALVLGLGGLVAPGCSVDPRSDDYRCSNPSDCPQGRTCDMGWCVVDNKEQSPDASSANCDPACSACKADGTCVIECNEPTGCAGAIQCPGDVPCEINCTADATCGADIDCSAASACSVVCDGAGSCGGPIVCGGGPCDIACSGTGSCGGSIDCQDACACDTACDGAGSCTGGHLCPRDNMCESGNECSSATGSCNRC